MKNTLFLGTYFNNPHFIKIQSALFKKFVEDEYEFAILDDSDDSATSLVSGQLAKDEIKSECLSAGVTHIKVPQSIHAHFHDGGYVPNPDTYHAPAVNHPSNRQQAVIRWMVANHKALGFSQYKTLVLMDADILIKKPMNIGTYMDADMIGTGRRQYIDLPLGQWSGNFFTDRVRTLDKSYVSFFNCCLLFINMQTVTNLEQMDIGTWPGTDTGSKTNFFIKDNPQYTYSFISDKFEPVSRVDLLAKNSDHNLDILGSLTPDQAEMVHYRAGSNWSYESATYYKAKLDRMLKRFIPDLGVSFDDVGGAIKDKHGDTLV